MTHSSQRARPQRERDGRLRAGARMVRGIVERRACVCACSRSGGALVQTAVVGGGRWRRACGLGYWSGREVGGKRVVGNGDLRATGSDEAEVFARLPGRKLSCDDKSVPDRQTISSWLLKVPFPLFSLILALVVVVVVLGPPVVVTCVFSVRNKFSRTVNRRNFERGSPYHSWPPPPPALSGLVSRCEERTSDYIRREVCSSPPAFAFPERRRRDDHGVPPNRWSG